MKILVIVFLLSVFQVNLETNIDYEKPENYNSGELNTAANANYLTNLEKEIIYEINLLRSNPADYADKYIAPLARNYKNRMFYFPGDDPLITREGVRALHECVRALKAATPLPLVYPNPGLSKAAEDHVKDQSGNGLTGHRGSDFSGAKERIERYGEWKIRIGENIAYGGKTARQIVIYLCIDDGVRNRGHRNTFLHPDYSTVGVATGYHPTYKFMSVMDFAGGFVEK